MNVTLERLEEIEREREEVMNQPEYRAWVKALNVSQSYVDPSGFFAAREMNRDYDLSKLHLDFNMQ